MGIDTTQKVEAGFFLKWITVKKLKKILADLPEDADVYPNAVGGLLVKHEDQPIGYIDLSAEEYCSMSTIKEDN